MLTSDASKRRPISGNAMSRLRQRGSGFVDDIKGGKISDLLRPISRSTARATASCRA